MGKHVRPIRAWAEYDEWSLFVDHFTAQSDRWRWETHSIPKTANGPLARLPHRNSLVEVFTQPANGLPRFDFGPLRSLRVLFENGYELRLYSESDPNIVMMPEKGRWFWMLNEGNAAAGRFHEDKDSEAVERAMIAAAAWFTQAEGLD